MMTSTQTFTSPAVNSGSTAATMMGSVQRFCQRWRAASWAGVSSGRSPSSRRTSPWTRLRVGSEHAAEFGRTPRRSCGPASGAPRHAPTVASGDASPHHRRRRLHRVSPRRPAAGQGHTVRALDALDPQVHEGGAARLPEPRGRAVARRPRPRRVARALDGVDTVVHFAAAVGVGQSMYEIERYTSINAVGARWCSRRSSSRRDQLAQVLVASSMSIYGEGCTAARRRPRRPRAPRCAERAARPPRVGCSARRRAARAVADGRDEAALPTSIYAVRQARPRGDVPRRRRGPAADRRAAVLQRLRRPPGAVEPVHGRGGDLRLAAAERPAPLVFEDGLQSRDFIHVTDIAARCSRRSSRRWRLPRRQPGHRCADHGARRRPRAGARPGQGHPARDVSKFRAGDIRHCVSDIALARELLGFEPRRGSTTACGSCWAGWRRSRRRTRSTRRRRSSRLPA